MKNQAGGGRAHSQLARSQVWPPGGRRLSQSGLVSVARGPPFVRGSDADTLGLPISVEAFKNGVSRTLDETKRNLIRILPSYTFVTEDYETR